jgi:hypothetical protein
MHTRSIFAVCQFRVSSLSKFATTSQDLGRGLSFFFFLVAATLESLLPLLEHRAEFPQFLDQGQSVGLLGPARRKASTCTQTQKNAHIHKH